jgi:hypothetical protein
MSNKRLLTWILIFGMVAGLFAVGRSQPREGILTVSVNDSSGATVSGATVLSYCWDADLMTTKISLRDPIKAVTDSAGRVEIALPVAPCDVIVLYPTMEPYSIKVRIERQKKSNVNATLKFSQAVDLIE